MSNIDAPFGLKPVRHLSGGSVRQAEYSIASGYSSNIFAGAPVEMTGTGKNIAVAAFGNADNIGVFVGCRYVDAAGSQQFSSYWPANMVATEIVAYVVDDPQVVFAAQATTIAEADVGQLADWNAGTGNTATGLSAIEVDGETYAGLGAALRILGLVPEPGNDYGANAKVEVIFAEHALSGVVSGVGGN